MLLTIGVNLTYYVLEGSDGTPFAGGYYYGNIKFPLEYPYKPPGITMTTPNGRFMTQKKICLSMSDCKADRALNIYCLVSIKYNRHLNNFG